MFLAADPAGARIAATPSGQGRCPQCGEPLIPKCGHIVTWHWAHTARTDCDPWSEPETAWHLDWKRRFPPDWIEVSVAGHRADVLTPQGWVVEFQHSHLPVAQIRERESAYGRRRLIWVFDLRAVEAHFDFRRRDYGWSFRWRHPRKTFWHVQARTVFDFGDRLFYCRKLHANVPCGGWGRFVLRDEFIDALTGERNSTAAAS